MRTVVQFLDNSYSKVLWNSSCVVNVFIERYFLLCLYKTGKFNECVHSFTKLKILSLKLEGIHHFRREIDWWAQEDMSGSSVRAIF